MEYILEFIFELFIEGGFTIITNKKISKWIRYPLLFIMGAFYLGLILVFIILGVKLMKESIILGLLMFAIELILVLGIIKLLKKNNRKQDER